MTKTELIDKMAKTAQLTSGKGTKTEAEIYLNSFLTILEDCVANEDPLKLVGYFTMEFVDRKQKIGINPKTLEKIVIPKCRKLKIKPGKLLLELVQQ